MSLRCLYSLGRDLHRHLHVWPASVSGFKLDYIHKPTVTARPVLILFHLKPSQCCKLCFHQYCSTMLSIENVTIENVTISDPLPVKQEICESEDEKLNVSTTHHECLETRLMDDHCYSVDKDEEEETLLLKSFKTTNRKLEHLQKVLNYNDSEMMSVIRKTPRVKFKLCTQKVIDNCKVLLQGGYDVRYIQAILHWKTSCAILLQVDPADLRNLLKQQNHTRKRLPKKRLCGEIEERFMNGVEDHFGLLSSRLGCSRDVLVKSASKQDLYFIEKRVHPSLLMEKVEYLVAEGISRQDIANFVTVLRYSMRKMQESIFRIQSEYGEVNVHFLRSLLLNKNTRAKPKRNNPVMKLFGILSRDKLSSLERQFIGSVNAVTAIESYRFLLDNNFSKDDIRQCIYILGHSADEIQHAWNKVKQLNHVRVHEDKFKLVNAILYIIEFHRKS